MTTKLTHDYDISDTLILLILKKIGTLVPDGCGLHLSLYNVDSQGVYTLYTKNQKNGALSIFITAYGLSAFIDKVLKFESFPKGWFS